MRNRFNNIFLNCSRCISDPVHGDAGPRGHPSVPHRTGHRTEDATGLLGRVEHHPPVAGRHRNLQLFSYVFRCALLQCDYYVVLLLFV